MNELDDETLALLRDIDKETKLKEQKQAKQSDANNTFTNTIQNAKKAVNQGLSDFGAGVIKSAVDIPVGLTQLASDGIDYAFNTDLGSSVDKVANKINQYYKDTTKGSIAGSVGQVAGGIGTALLAPQILPAKLAGGTSTLANILKGGAIGAAQGLAQPIYDNTDHAGARQTNAIAGGVLGGALPAVAKIGGSLGIGKKASTANEIARNSNMQNSELANLLRKNHTLVEGSNPTVTEIVPTPANIGQYNRLKNKGANIQGDFPLAVRQSDNNFARVNSLREAGGSPQDLDALRNFRANEAQNTYSQLKPVPLTDEIKYALDQPYTQSELGLAQRDFNANINPLDRLNAVQDNKLNPQAVRLISTGLNSKTSPNLNITPDEARIFGKEANLFDTTIDDLDPAYKEAKAQYRANSQPITDAESAYQLLGYKTNPNGGINYDLDTKNLDAQGNPKLTYGQYNSTLARLLNDKYPPSQNTLENSFNPIQQDLKRETVLNNNVGATGSQTDFNVQNSGVGNLLPNWAGRVIDRIADNSKAKQSIEYLLNKDVLAQQLTSGGQRAYDTLGASQPFMGSQLSQALINYMNADQLDPIEVEAPKNLTKEELQFIQNQR